MSRFDHNTHVKELIRGRRLIIAKLTREFVDSNWREKVERAKQDGRYECVVYVKYANKLSEDDIEGCIDILNNFIKEIYDEIHVRSIVPHMDYHYIFLSWDTSSCLIV